MAEVKSKNLYELLGNDEEGSDAESGPTTAIDKPVNRTSKRNGPEAVPDRTAGGDRGGRGGARRGGFSGSEDAYRDRGAGSQQNRGKPTDDNTRDDRHPRRGGGPGRGGGGGRGGGRGRENRDGRDDRHSRGVPNEHVKQTDQSWGAQTGGSEWDDEKAGEAIAKADTKDPAAAAGPDAPTDADGNALPTAGGEDGAGASAPEPEPEDNSKSYAEYLAEQASKKLSMGGTLEARKPNEGSKPDKKWAGAKAISREGEEDTYMAPKEKKAARERERKEKQVVDIDHRFVEAPRGGGERGRGRGGRGDGFRGRGEGRGDGFRGRGDGRGRGGRGGGEFRGGRGGGGGRGGRGGDQVNLADTSAFPSLGS